MWLIGVTGIALAEISEVGTANVWLDLPSAISAVREYPAGAPVTLSLVSGDWETSTLQVIQDLEVALVLEDATGQGSALPAMRILDETVTFRDVRLAPGNGLNPPLEVDGGLVTLENVEALGGEVGVVARGGATIDVVAGLYDGFSLNAFTVEAATLLLDGDVTISNNSGLASSAIIATEGAHVEFGLGTFGPNASVLSAGLLNATNATVIVHANASVVDNSGLEGGAFLTSLTSVTVEAGAIFSGNSAGSSGGAMSVYAGSLSIDGAVFTDNTAALYGGAIAVYDVADAVLTNSSFVATEVGQDAAGFAGGALSLSLVTNLQASTNTFVNLSTGALGSGGAVYLGYGDATFTDTTTTAASSAIAGGFAYVEEAELTLSGGTFVATSSGSGGVVYGANATLILEDLVVLYPSVYLAGGLASVVDGQLTVRNTIEAGGTGLAGLGVYATGATVEITDSAFVDNVSWGGGGAITLDENDEATLTRVVLCGNADPFTHPAILATGRMALHSSRIWNNQGGNGAVGLYPGSGLPASLAHNTFADNGSLSIYAAEAASFDHNLFAPGVGNSAIHLDAEPVIEVPPPNFLESGATGEVGMADLGFVTASPIFQESRPFSCLDTLFVSWDDPIAVDWTPDGSDAADLDGTAPDFGAFGGPYGWPAELWDVDGDDNRNDLDCALEDGERWYGNPDGNRDCDCDTDGDGWLEAWCTSGGADCDDGDAAINPNADDAGGDATDSDCDGLEPECDLDTDGFLDVACGGDDCNDRDDDIHPGAIDLVGDGIDADCDGDAPGDPGPGAAPTDGLLTFGGGGCAHAPWAPTWAAVFALALTRARRPRARG